jgi:hypothetical protein
MTRSLPRSTAIVLAIGLALSACGTGEPSYLLPTAPASPAAVLPGPTPTAVAPTTAPPPPNPTETPKPVAALVHCTGTPTAGLGDSFHRRSTWAGYVAAEPPGTFSCVEGSWIEPGVACGTGESAVAIWVGIGGYSSNDLHIGDDGHALEQAGTGVDCDHGVARHYAWHQRSPVQADDTEYGPTASQPEPMVIAAGDRIWAQVRFAEGRYRMTVANLTTGQSRAVIQASPGLQRSSAQWVVDAEDGQPMPRFSPIVFSAGLATMEGLLGPMGSAAWLRNEVDLWGDGTMRARISPLTDGASFSVTWLHG